MELLVHLFTEGMKQMCLQENQCIPKQLIKGHSWTHTITQTHSDIVTHVYVVAFIHIYRWSWGRCVSVHSLLYLGIGYGKWAWSIFAQSPFQPYYWTQKEGFNEPFAVSLWNSVNLSMHVLIFEKSIWLLVGSTRYLLHWIRLFRYIHVWGIITLLSAPVAWWYMQTNGNLTKSCAGHDWLKSHVSLLTSD